MPTDEKVMVFLDGSNLFWGQKYFAKEHQRDGRVDVMKLIANVLDGRRLVRATYYCSRPERISPGQKSFHAVLRDGEIMVIEKALKERVDLATGQVRCTEKGVDVALATDLLAFAWENAYDTAILVSGDADYIGAVNKVMDKGKNVELVSFKCQCSRELKDRVVSKIYIDDIFEQVKLIL